MSQSQMIGGQRVLVTGAGTGIGKGVALAFARAGAMVALHHSHGLEPDVQAAVEQIRDAGGTIELFHADFRDIEQVKQLGRDAIEKLGGGIDALINNAGITFSSPFLETKPEQFDVVFAVNVRAMYFLIQAVVPVMERQGRGAVVNLASDHAYHGMHEHAIYAGSKGAIVSTSRSLAVELGPKNIRVNCIVPGWIFVESHARQLPDFKPENAGGVVPLGRVGRPDDIAKLAMFLCSDQADYLTGHAYVCDGGLTAVMSHSDAFRKPLEQRWGSAYVEEK